NGDADRPRWPTRRRQREDRARSRAPLLALDVRWRRSKASGRDCHRRRQSRQGAHPESTACLRSVTSGRRVQPSQRSESALEGHFACSHFSAALLARSFCAAPSATFREWSYDASVALRHGARDCMASLGALAYRPCLLTPCEAARMKPCGPLHFAVVPALTVERPGPLFSGSSTPARAGAAK